MVSDPHNGRQSLNPRTGALVARRLTILLLVLGLVACATVVTPQYGVSGGALYPCPSSRACVASTESGSPRAVAPFEYKGDRRDARADLMTAIQTFEGVRIVSSHRNYLRAEFPSNALRNQQDESEYYFAPRAGVDDVEFWFPPGEFVIHVRSASRLGLLDLGENRERVEQLRRLFERLQTRRELREPR
jgi:uncharacterized protein (DUF1499 family)